MSVKAATILALIAGPLVDHRGHPLDRLDRERETRQLRHRLREVDRAVGSRLGEANALLSMAGMETDPETGKPRFEQALALYRAIGDVYSVARGLYYYALYLRDHGQDADAIPLLEQSAAMFEERGLPEIAATARAAIPS